MPKTNASEFAIKWWQNRHEIGYFPAMDQHKDWKVYDSMPDWFLTAVKPDTTDVALEIGCGYGQWMVPLSRLVGTVRGFDIHQSLVTKAREKFRENGVSNARVMLGDGRTIPFTDRMFTLVYSISVFQHMPRALVADYLAESKRVLMPGGRALFHFRADDGIGPYSKDINVNHDGDWSVGWSIAEVHAAAEAIGFTHAVVDLGDVLLLVCH